MTQHGTPSKCIFKYLTKFPSFPKITPTLPKNTPMYMKSTLACNIANDAYSKALWDGVKHIT